MLCDPQHKCGACLGHADAREKPVATCCIVPGTAVDAKRISMRVAAEDAAEFRICRHLVKVGEQHPLAMAAQLKVDRNGGCGSCGIGTWVVDAADVVDEEDMLEMIGKVVCCVIIVKGVVRLSIWRRLS